MPLHILLDDDLERLLRRWRQVVPPLRDPFAPEVIVIGAKGLDRWLHQQLAAEDGVAAHIDLPFVEPAVRRLLAGLLGNRPWHAGARDDVDPWRPGHLRWQVAAVLHEIAGQGDVPDWAMSVCQAVRMTDDGAGGRLDGARLLGFAEQVTAALMTAMVHHPHALQDGSLYCDVNGAPLPEGRWQQEVWTRLCARIREAHPGNWMGMPPSARVVEALERIDRGDFDARGLPPRITVFGFSSLPEPWLELFARLGCSEAVDIDVALAFWAPTTLLSETSDLQRRLRVHDPVEQDVPLFSLCGAATVHLQQVLFGRLGLEWDPVDATESPQSLLAAIQHDIRTLGSDRVQVAGADGSLTLDCCYSRLREVEVMRNRVLAALADGIPPHRIAVMAPNIEAYAPLIEWVFGESLLATGSGGNRQMEVPHDIADRSAPDSDPVVSAVLSLLDLRMSGLPVAQVIGTLYATDLSLVTRIGRARLPVGTIETLAAAFRDLGIVRAWDGDDPFSRQWSWREGLDRGLIAGLLPRRRSPWMVEDLSVMTSGKFGDTAEQIDVLAVVDAFLDRVMSLSETARSMAQWCADLADWLSDLIHIPSELPEMKAAFVEVRRTLAALATEAGDLRLDVDLNVVRRILEQELAARSPSWQFLRGGVTVCALSPLRAVPFDVICIMGLDDGAFPVVEREPAWQLRRRPVSRRDEALSAFLETFMAARRRLHLSWQGRDARTAETVPPSPVVAAVRDAMAAVRCAGGAAAASTVEIVHPLHPFSPRAFVPGNPCCVTTARGQPVGRPADGAAARRLSSGSAAPDGSSGAEGPWRFWPLERLGGGLERPRRVPWRPRADAGSLPAVPLRRAARVLALHHDTLLELRYARLPDGDDEPGNWPRVSLQALERADAVRWCVDMLSAGASSEAICNWLMGSGWLPAVHDQWKQAALICGEAQEMYTLIEGFLGGRFRPVMYQSDTAAVSSGARGGIGMAGGRVQGAPAPEFGWRLSARWFWATADGQARLVIPGFYKDRVHFRLYAWLSHLVMQERHPGLETLYIFPVDGRDGRSFTTVRWDPADDPQQARAWRAAARRWFVDFLESPPFVVERTLRKMQNRTSLLVDAASGQPRLRARKKREDMFDLLDPADAAAARSRLPRTVLDFLDARENAVDRRLWTADAVERWWERLDEVVDQVDGAAGAPPADPVAAEAWRLAQWFADVVLPAWQYGDVERRGA